MEKIQGNIIILIVKYRKEGLCWIIKSIWKLGYEVIISLLPQYLDENIIKYLFEVNIIYKRYY